MSSTSPSADARIFLVIGKKGSGKSSRIKRGLALVPSFVVWDLRGEYAHPTAGVPGARLWTDMAAFFRHLLDGGEIGREVFACPVWQFETWCKWVFETGNLVAVIEELPRVCPGGTAPAALADLLDRNRHAAVDLICAASRTAGIPKSVPDQADELICATQREPNAVRYLAGWLGDAAAARIRALQPFSFLRIRL